MISFSLESVSVSVSVLLEVVTDLTACSALAHAGLILLQCDVALIVDTDVRKDGGNVCSVRTHLVESFFRDAAE